MHKALISAGLLLIGLGLRADTAEDYFHRGAQRYVFDEPDKARVEVKIGLAQYPDDPKLKKLAKLLKLDEDAQQQQASKQQKQDQNQPEEKPDPSEQEQKQKQEQAQQKEDQQKDAAGGDQQKDQAKQDKEQGNDKGDKQSGEQEQASQAPAVAGQMTPQQAQQLLDSQKGQEKALIFVPAKRNDSKNRVFKDW
jgi:hypothetical protein